MTEPIRVLQVVASLNAGGMENYIMNLYRMVDKSKVQFDFVVHHAAVGLYEDEMSDKGSTRFIKLRKRDREKKL